MKWGQYVLGTLIIAAIVHFAAIIAKIISASIRSSVTMTDDACSLSCFHGKSRHCKHCPQCPLLRAVLFVESVKETRHEKTF